MLNLVCFPMFAGLVGSALHILILCTSSCVHSTPHFRLCHFWTKVVQLDMSAIYEPRWCSMYFNIPNCLRTHIQWSEIAMSVDPNNLAGIGGHCHGHCHILRSLHNDSARKRNKTMAQLFYTVRWRETLHRKLCQPKQCDRYS